MDIITCINSIKTAYYPIILGLTPRQRWDALTKHHSSSASNHLFIIIGLGIVGILLVLLLFRSIINRIKNNQKNASRQPFINQAKEKGLTEGEYNLLRNIAGNAGLKRAESIFSLPSVFEREALKMLNNTELPKGTDQYQQLEKQLISLRQKLSFNQCLSQNKTFQNSNSDIHSTQQIPVKKKIYIKLPPQQKIGDLEAVIINNNTTGLTVELKDTVEIVFGHPWTCRFYSGPYIAEFNTIVKKCKGNIVVLKHSEQVRFVNRRKFLRVPVQKPAYIARFPFTKDGSTEHTRKKIISTESLSKQKNAVFELPHFVPATVTELGGPGLRITTDLELNVGERVLLMFRLEDRRARAISSKQASLGKIIEHIAVVRHIVNHKRSAIALELIGLHSDGINELIRETNKASIDIQQQQSNIAISSNYHEKKQYRELLTV